MNLINFYIIEKLFFLLITNYFMRKINNLVSYFTHI
jgi:hypothetical protein